MGEREVKQTIENHVDREEEYQRCFWARRQDGIVVDKEKEICYVLELKSKMDRWMGYREEATDESVRDESVRELDAWTKRS